MSRIISSQPPPWLLPDLDRWIGNRLYCFQESHDNQIASVAFVSSQLARPLYHQKHWFSNLNSALQMVGQTDIVVVTSPRTTTYRFIQACANEFNLRLSNTVICRTQKQWKKLITAEYSTDSNECIISPPQSLSNLTRNPPNCIKAKPERDRFLIGGAQQVYVIEGRIGSKTQRLLKRREAQTIWMPKLPDPNISRPPAYHPPPSITDTPYLLPKWFNPNATLAHWTRAADGPWPLQSESDWYLQLVHGWSEADHSALATLQNIVSKEVIYGTGRTIREGHKVVCLTRVPISRWQEQHIYRPHLRRWDFCPYGVVFSPTAISRITPTDVQYGDEDLWKRLRPSDRPYFQAIDCNIDWTIEQEQRVLGDIVLRSLQNDDLILFTQTAWEAEQLQIYSRWPIVPFDYLQRTDRIQT